MFASLPLRPVRSPVLLLLYLVLLAPVAGPNAQHPQPAGIPLPEHPRPDWRREQWLNLNGEWDFRFDPENRGEAEKWFQSNIAFNRRITVPFSWGSPLSGVGDEADIAWYARRITVPETWSGKRIFLVVGASDWRTSAWFDGEFLGTFQGGYTPFEFELTANARPGSAQPLVLRVDDSPHPFKLEGKQGYGKARGIWQTPYLEARGSVTLEAVHFSPDIDQNSVRIKAYLHEPPAEDGELSLHFQTADLTPVTQAVPTGAAEVEFEVAIPGARLWSLEDPFLYEVTAHLKAGPGPADEVHTYFGMRKISVVPLPGHQHPYIALNNQPVYLQTTLDQAYHSEGFYTFPSDAFMRDEILRSRRIGLNGMRIHVKIGIPRKLYWADRLGMLIMADVPNSWGEPTDAMRQESETALRRMIRRDFNHPAIFSWVLFNETWGLETSRNGDDSAGGKKVYLKETQDWVEAMYHQARALDPTRLVEDNSPHKFDHVITDINSWHAYLPGYRWETKLNEISGNTFPGSSWNYVQGKTQDADPLFNSECGNVWGYEGSTGDIDWSWDYHLMMDAFRRHPKVCGWLYTEHHDVINEWNGYYRFDRSEKFTGLDEIVEGMSLLDLHSPLYIALGTELIRTVKPAETVEVPLWASFMTGDRRSGERLRLRFELSGWNTLGQKRRYWSDWREIEYRPWRSEALSPLQLQMPDEPSLAVLAVFLEDLSGHVLHRNFTAFRVADGPSPRDERVEIQGRPARVFRIDPASFSRSEWSLKQWEVLDGLKVNGAGFGYFEYAFKWPEDLGLEQVAGAGFLMEASAKQLFGKDREDAERIEGNFMLGGGTNDPSLNRNAYPMTDTRRFPSAVRIRINGHSLGIVDLADDPADHRGLLSWFSQLRDGYLREAGSYGYLVSAAVPAPVLDQAAAAGRLVIRLEVDEALPGGLAIYGERFGRFPLDPTLVLVLREGH